MKNRIVTKKVWSCCFFWFLLFSPSLLPFSGDYLLPLLSLYPVPCLTLPNLASISSVLLEWHPCHDFLLDGSLSLVKPAALKLSSLALKPPTSPHCFTFFPNYGQFSKLTTWGSGLCALYPRPLEKPPFREAIAPVLLTLTPIAPSNLILSFWAFVITPLGYLQLSSLVLHA